MSKIEVKVERLEKEADWLAEKCREFCQDQEYCKKCTMWPVDCPKKKEITSPYQAHEVKDWRMAAKEAVEAKCEK